MFRMCTCSFFTRLAFFYKFTAVSSCVRTIISVYCSDLAFPEWLALCTVLGDRNLASIHQVRQVRTTAMQLCLVFKHPLTNLQKRKQKPKKRKKERKINLFQWACRSSPPSHNSCLPSSSKQGSWWVYMFNFGNQWQTQLLQTILR